SVSGDSVNMHVAHITSHFASLDYWQVIRGGAQRRIFVAALSHRCNRSREKNRAGDPSIARRGVACESDDADATYIGLSLTSSSPVSFTSILNLSTGLPSPPESRSANCSSMLTTPMMSAEDGSAGFACARAITSSRPVQATLSVPTAPMTDCGVTSKAPSAFTSVISAVTAEGEIGRAHV